jgi:excisionase family DNA binding protein
VNLYSPLLQRTRQPNEEEEEEGTNSTFLSRWKISTKTIKFRGGNTMRKEKPLTTGQISAYCHVSYVTVLKWIKEGRLKAYTIPSGHYRVQKSDFHDFLLQYKMPVDEEFFGGHATRILVVGDEAETFKFISAALGEGAGDYELALAANGFEAGLQLASFQPDLLILDLTMPDNLEVCRNVKANPATRHTKILVLTESSQKDEVHEALASGANDHLTRPLNAEELRQKVQNLKQS